MWRLKRKRSGCSCHWRGEELLLILEGLGFADMMRRWECRRSFMSVIALGVRRPLTTLTGRRKRNLRTGGWRGDAEFPKCIAWVTRDLLRRRMEGVLLWNIIMRRSWVLLPLPRVCIWSGWRSVETPVMHTIHSCGSRLHVFEGWSSRNIGVSNRVRSVMTRKKALLCGVCWRRHGYPHRLVTKIVGGDGNCGA